MKISGYPLLFEFLKVLFAFFKKNKIHTIAPDDLTVNNYDYLLERVINAEFLDFKYCPNVNCYCVNFKIDNLEESGDYIYQFGREESTENNQVILSFEKKSNVQFVHISFNSEKYLPFVYDFMTDDSKFTIYPIESSARKVVVSDSEIFSMKEFKYFLEENSNEISINVVSVE